MKEQMINYLKLLGVSFLILLIISKIIFYNTDIFVVLRVLLAIYWILILPGLAVSTITPMASTIARFVIGVPISAALLGTTAYYLGLLGVNIKYSAIYLPMAVMLLVLLVRVVAKGKNNIIKVSE